MWPALNQMKFASCWQLAEWKFCRYKQLAHCLAPSVLQARWDDIFLIKTWTGGMKFLKHQAAHLQEDPMEPYNFSPSQTGETVPLNTSANLNTIFEDILQ